MIDHNNKRCESATGGEQTRFYADQTERHKVFARFRPWVYDFGLTYR